MANSNQYFLLADHIKLSLLERQRAVSLNLEPTSQDGHISRSLDSLREGLESISTERIRLQEAGDLVWASLNRGMRLGLMVEIVHQVRSQKQSRIYRRNTMTSLRSSTAGLPTPHPPLLANPTILRLPLTSLGPLNDPSQHPPLPSSRNPFAISPAGRRSHLLNPSASPTHP
jgi:hypothetical protein